MKLCVMIAIIFSLYSGLVSADCQFGISIDTSSNMLMRPGGVSGSIASVYGEADHSTGNLYMSYGFDAGVVERYNGIQYHYHAADLSYDVFSRKDAAFTVAVEGALARYDDVTVLEGFTQFGLSGRTKWYLGQATLLRWEVEFRKRSYKIFDTESYLEGNTLLRFDRFLDSGTTLRGQLEAGIREHSELPSSFSTSLFGIRARLAQSLSPLWGIWFELQKKTVNSSGKPETSLLYDRIFLDDRYKSSSTGGVLSTKYLFKSSGSVNFKTIITKRSYGKELTSSYWYLPEDGWNEWEWSAFFTIAWNPGFLSAPVHPSFEVYHISVDSSINTLSYNVTGVTLSFEIY